MRVTGHEEFACPGAVRPDVLLDRDADSTGEPHLYCLECRANLLDEHGMQEAAKLARTQHEVTAVAR